MCWEEGTLLLPAESFCLIVSLVVIIKLQLSPPTGVQLHEVKHSWDGKSAFQVPKA